MKRASATIVLLAIFGAGISWGMPVWGPATIPPLVIAPAVIGQAGGFVQSGPQFVKFGTPIHLSVGGAGVLSGSYPAYEEPAGSPNTRTWKASFVTPHPTLPGKYTAVQGRVLVERAVDTTQNPPAIYWKATAGYGDVEAGNGSFTGVRVNPGLSVSRDVILTGPDFGVSGSGPFTTPAGAGVVSITVSP